MTSSELFAALAAERNPDPRRQQRRQRLVLLGGILLPFLFLIVAPQPAWAQSELFEIQKILDAIRWIESGYRPNPPDGDGGKAIGPYQIHGIYWRDALLQEPGLNGSYEMCRERVYAESVITAYMQRYAPEAWLEGHAQTIARIHNGGPRGAHKEATLPYWKKVEDRLRLMGR